MNNNQRIIDWVDGLFTNIALTDTAREQKEELQIHLTDRVKDYMHEGMDFDRAFSQAKDDLGDLDELMANFKKKSKVHLGISIDRDDDETEGKWKFRFHCEGLIALSPFIYIILGIAFGWWAWGWMIIPVSAIIFGVGKEDFGAMMCALSPFIYLALGAWFGWWVWGWIVIPAFAIIFGGEFISVKKEKEKKKKKSARHCGERSDDAIQ